MKKKDKRRLLKMCNNVERRREKKGLQEVAGQQ